MWYLADVGAVSGDETDLPPNEHLRTRTQGRLRASTSGYGEVRVVGCIQEPGNVVTHENLLNCTDFGKSFGTKDRVVRPSGPFDQCRSLYAPEIACQSSFPVSATG